MIRLLHGNCVMQLCEFRSNVFDAVVTDPPYHLDSITKRFGAKNSAPAKSNGATGVYKRYSEGFVGEQWDDDYIAFDSAMWYDVWRVMKPGAYLFSFASARNYDKLASALRRAGFIIHPMFGWINGQGFPKPHHVELPDWGGWSFGSAVKPALEPICWAQKPISEKTVTANVKKWGTGAVNVKAGSEHGRWPSNVIHDDSEWLLPNFFYCAKADKDDRRGSKHPTVKPVDLKRYLVKLITPPGGTVLDPFAGTGTTLEAAICEGFGAVGIERDERWYLDARARLEGLRRPRERFEQRERM